MLPYETLEEAEEAIGRGLSFAQRLWFRYSANKSDFLLHCHNIVFLCFFYSVASLPYVFIGLCNSKRIQNYKVQHKVSHTFWEMFRCYKNVMHTFILAVGPLQIVSFPTIKLLGIRTDLLLPSGRELFLQLSVYFIIEDFANYWIHRILHSRWAYQKIHKVHHEYKAPIGLAAPYAHWAEILILGFPSFLGPFWFPVILLRIGSGSFCDNWKPLRLTAVMNSHGVPQNTYHFMEALLTMTTITSLVKVVSATLPPYSPIVI